MEIAIIILTLLVLYISAFSAMLKHQSFLKSATIKNLETKLHTLLYVEKDDNIRLNSSINKVLYKLISNKYYYTVDEGPENKTRNILLDESINQLKKISTTTIPFVNNKKTIADSIKLLCNQLLHKIPEIYFNKEGEDLQVDEGFHLLLYKIFMECFMNIAEHSQAEKVFISLHQSSECISAIIEDDGKGFEKSKAGSEKPIGGINRIQSLIHILHGKLDISCIPSKGTVIAFHIPSNFFSKKEFNYL